jgi:hypothetical protein
VRLVALALTASLPLSAAHFAPRPGWRAGSDRPHACPGVPAKQCSQVTSWAATVPWQDCADCLPHLTTNALPPNGIAIQVTLSTETPPHWIRRANWPPRIRKGDVVAGFEGLRDRIGVYQHYMRVGRLDAAVWAFFGRPLPTAAQLLAANTELAAARLPR